MKRKLLVGLTACLLLNNVFGQIQNQQWFQKLNNPTENLQKAYYQKSSYLSSSSNSNAASDKELKKLARNSVFWKSRLGPDGSMRSGAKMMKNGISKRCTTSVGGLWESLGPFITPVDCVFYDPNVSQVGYGKLQSFEVDPNNENIIYAGCEGAGLFKTTDGGKTWANLTDKLGYIALGVLDIAINPFNSNDIYFASGHGGYSGVLGYGLGIFHSSNGGNTWNRIDTDPNAVNVEEALCVKFAPFEQDQVFMGIGRKLYKLTNPNNKNSISGWNLVDSVPVGDMFRDIEFIRQNNSSKNYHVFAASQNLHNYTTKRSLHKAFYNSTTNALSSFTDITPDSDLSILHFDIETTPADPGALYVYYASKITNNVTLKKSTDFGTSFTTEWTIPMTHTNFKDMYARTLGYLALSPTVKNRYYVSDIHVSVSTNNSLWTSGNNYKYHRDVRDLKVYNSNGKDKVIIANDGGLSTSDDKLLNWRELFYGQPITEVYRLDVDKKSSKIIIGTLDNGTYAYDRSGNWMHIEGGDGGPSVFLDNNQKYDYAAMANGKFVVNNIQHKNYLTYKVIYDSARISEFSGYTFLQRYFKDRFSDDHLFFTHKKIYRYNINTYDINDMTRSNSLTNEGAFIVGIDQSYSNPQKMYVVSNNVNPLAYNNVQPDSLFFKSTNRGTTFINKSSDPLLKSAIKWGTSITDVAVSPKNDEHVYITLGGYKPNNETNYRVFASANGGTSWTNITHNLPNAPATTIVIDKNTGVIYIGTDAGVYFLDQTHPSQHSTWQCFNNGMPPVIINQLVINYCTGKLVAGTFGKGVWQNDLVKSMNNRYVVSTNEAWNNNKAFSTDVMIPNGATLTISNAKIWMASGKTITIEPGGKLIANNSTLTHSCPDGLWGGIIVKGNAAASQEPGVNNAPHPAQGLVRLNNSTVEFAREAIRTYDPDSWVHQGGMVYAYNSTFRNNKRNAAFRMYENKLANGTVVDYRSGFTKCTFKVDTDFPKTEKYGEHMVTLWRVRGVDFEGCSFKNETGKTLKLQGIYAHNADLLVSEHCSSGASPCPTASKVKSEFKNLYNGVVATGYGMPYKTTISLANFTHYTNAGIVIDGVDYATIVQNKFDQNNLSSSSTIATMGVYLNNSNKYTVQENLFVGGTDNPNVFKFGIVARSSGGDNNLIYKNQFQGMHLGNVADRNNSDSQDLHKGLKYKCNLNTGNKGHDIYITTQGLGVAKYQGAIGDEANNSFSSTVGTEGHIFNRDQSAKTLVYTHLQNVNNKILAPTKYTPIRVALNPSSNPGSNAQCLTDLEYFHQFIRGRFKTGNGLETVKGNYEQAKTNYINTQYIYGITIDNGNTAGLISQVQSSVPAQMWQLRTQLINSSPLSEDVIVNTIDENALNNTLLYEVLFKNTDALRNPEIVQKLQSKKDPMPSYMLNVLLGKTGEISAKDKLLMKLSSYSQQASTAATYVIRHYQADSIYNEGDSLLAWLGKVNTPESTWFKAGYYLNKGNYSAAQQSMSGISGMTKLQQDKHTYLAGFQTLYKTAAQSNMSQLGAPNEGLKIQLAQKAQLESTKEGQSYATNWLRWGEQKVYITSTIPYPASSGKRSAGNSILVPYNGEQFNGIIVTPNPAREYINVQFTDLEETSYEFQLLDNLGRVVRRSTLNGPTGNQSIELKQLPTGVYHYRVLWKNQLVTNGKLSLVK